ncbi:FAD binding domain-containing protein [Evansella sp. AB-rgal1]|uniref:FAD binding domain-containing protein n=1 Tax=Evansella sp. AB-rgal1 TaxID=3242696 RepID=UPI00359E5AAB
MHTQISQPKDLQEAWSLRQRFDEDGCYISGGTWLRTQWEAKAFEMSSQLISLDKLLETKGISEKEILADSLEISIGAMTTLAECTTSSIIQRYLLPLFEACKAIAAPSIRNQGTIGGNILTTTGDSITALLLYDTKLCWYGGKGLEVEPLEAWLLKRKAGVIKKERRILVKLQIPIVVSEVEEGFSFYQKVGRREAFIPSVVTVAAKWISVESDSIQSIAISAGGGSAIPMRLSKAEQVLEMQKRNKLYYPKIQKVIKEEYEPATDAFASGEYRKIMAANVILSEFHKWSTKS